MEVSTFSNPLQTIQMISVYTYLSRIEKYFRNQESKYISINTSFSILNSLNNFWDDNKNNHNEHARLIRKLLRKSDLYGEKATEKLDPKYMSLMVDYIVHTTVFEKYGNIYGFLGEIVRKSGTLSIHVILDSAKKTLRKLTHDQDKNTTLSENTFVKIFYGSIKPLFPESKRNLQLDSLDFIYAQAGQVLYNSDLKLENTNYFFTLDSSIIFDNADNYLIDDYIEIALAIEQLVIKGEINKTTLKIFALPALLLHVYHERENLQELEMKQIVTDSEFWVKAYDRLFGHLRDKIAELQETLKIDSRYQYFLAAFQFEEKRTIAGREILMNCKLTDSDRLEQEVDRFLNNSDNFKCPGSEEKMLVNLTEVYENQVGELIYKYYFFAKSMINDDDDPIEDPGSSPSDQNNPVSEKMVPDDDKFSRYKFGLIKSHKPETDFQIPLTINRKSFEFCNETSIFAPDFLNTFSLQNLMPIEKKFNESRANKTHCLSSVLPCFAGIIEGNPINTSSNCPVSGAIRFKILQNSKIIRQFTLSGTRKLLSRLGTSLRTLALKTSMQTALSRENFIWKVKIDLHFMTNSTEIGFPGFPVVDRGYEIADSLGMSGLKTMNNLMKHVESDFFISFQADSRNFTINSQFVNKTSIKVDRMWDKNIYLKMFYGEPDNYYGYRFIVLNDGEIAELRSVPYSEDKDFVRVVNVTEKNQNVYKVVNIIYGELVGDYLYHTDQGTLSVKKNN